MQQHAETFPQETFQPEPKKEPEKKSAEILPFRRYEEYKDLGGMLSPEEYWDVLKIAKEKKEVSSDSLSSGAAKFMAGEIALSPETITLYKILEEKRSGLAKEREKELSDQELLVEALRIVGNKSSLDMFIKRFTPTVFH